MRVNWKISTQKFVRLQKFLLKKNRRYIILNLKEVDKFSIPLKFQLEMKICPPCPPFLEYILCYIYLYFFIIEYLSYQYIYYKINYHKYKYNVSVNKNLKLKIIYSIFKMKKMIKKKSREYGTSFGKRQVIEWLCRTNDTVEYSILIW